MLSDNENNDIRSFFSLYKNKVYELELPEACGKRCWGSPHGWIVIIGSDLEIHLLNPFSGARINLPPQSTFDSQFDFHSAWYQFIDKSIIIKKSNESHTMEEEFLVMVIYSPYQDLAFSRPGYSSWVNVEVSSYFRFIDVVLFNDQIFALCYVGNLVVIDIDATGPPIVLYIASPPHQLAWEKLYLVQSSGDLLMVYRYEYVTLSGYPSLTQFEVYKFDLSLREWTKLEDLGNMALFVGDNYSMSVSSSNIFNCECNKIYFISDTVEQWWSYNESFIGRDVGMYCMADGTVEPFFFGADYSSYYSCPIWAMPSLS